MRSGEELYFTATRSHSLNETINLVRLSASLPDFRDNYVTVNITVNARVALGSDETVLLRVIQPVACSTCSDNTLKLIGLDPNDLLTSFVSPCLETLSSELHSSTSDPQKDEAFLLQQVDAETLHFFVFESAVRKLGHSCLRSCGCPMEDRA